MNRSSISAEELFPCARWGSMDGGSLAVPRFRIFASPDGPAPPPPHAATDTIAAASRAVTPRRIYPFICIPFISDLSDAAQRAFPAYVMARHDLSVGDAPPFDHAFEKIIDEEFLAVLRRGHARPPPFGRHGPAGDDPPLLFEMQDAVRSEEHTSELQSLMRISYAVFSLTKQN